MGDDHNLHAQRSKGEKRAGRKVTRSRRKASQRKFHVERLERFLAHVTAMCLALLVICQVFLTHPYGRSWLPFVDAPEGQAWPAHTTPVANSGWLTLTASPQAQARARVILSNQVVGTLEMGSLTFQVREGDELRLDATAASTAITVRVSASYRVRFPARGAWVSVPAGEQVSWGDCKIHK